MKRGSEEAGRKKGVKRGRENDGIEGEDGKIRHIEEEKSKDLKIGSNEKMRTRYVI